jgi:hypothetical protein
MKTRVRFAIVAVCVAARSLSPDVSPGRKDEPKPAAPVDPDDLRIVDCLLPGQVRKLGQRTTYVSRRQAVRTVAVECEIRGGEYVDFDRADYETALAVWMASAEEGDPAAQYYVGEIYERGLGTDPDYAQAAEWYRRSAEQGHARAQTNLGFLYERGLGVERDPRAALEWYRKASDLPFVLMLDSEKQELEQRSGRLAALEARVADLTARLGSTEAELSAERESGRASAERIASLESSLASLRGEIESSKTEMAALEETRQAPEAAALAARDVAGPSIEVFDASDLRTRSAQVQPGPRERKLVGRVTAPAGLQAFEVDGAVHAVYERGLFEIQLSADAD